MCLFLTRKACKDFNDQMLSAMDTDLHKIICVDEINELSSSRKWSEKATKLLEKLNKDSNLTELTPACRCTCNTAEEHGYGARACKWCHWNCHCNIKLKIND